MLYHRDVFWKEKFDKQSYFLIKSIKHVSYHIDKNLGKDSSHDYDIPSLFLAILRVQGLYRVKPFEVETYKGRVIKCVVRVEYDATRDISIVFRQGYVATAWLNDKCDSHVTLDYSRYAKGKLYERKFNKQRWFRI